VRVTGQVVTYLEAFDDSGLLRDEAHKFEELLVLQYCKL